MSSARPKSPEFKPNQLVLCRYESYPYWPANITNNFPTEVLEGYRCQLATDEGTFFFYWCLFCDEDKGGWVREDRIVLFHPALIPYARISTGNMWYRDQQKAFRAALKLFNALHSKALNPKPVDPIPDLLFVHNHGGDLHEAEDHYHLQAEDPQPARPKMRRNNRKRVVEKENADGQSSLVKKEASIAQSCDHRVTGKRTAPHEASESENQNPSQKQKTDDMLVVSVVPAVGDNLGEGAEVTFFAPPPPEECLVSLPEQSTYHSRPTSSASFSTMMTELEDRIVAYRESSKDAEEAHHIFDVEKEHIRRKYKGLFERLRQIEKRSADNKNYLVMLLIDILQARVDISDLGKFHAGKKIKALGNECRGVPAIHTLCEVIAKVWIDAVNACFE